MDSLTQGEELVRNIYKSLVDNPELLHVDASIDERGVLIEVEPDKADLGRIIGKEGATANAVRLILRALGTKTHAHYSMKVIDRG